MTPLNTSPTTLIIATLIADLGNDKAKTAAQRIMQFFRAVMPEELADTMRDELGQAFRVAHEASSKNITVEDLSVGTSQAMLYEKLDISDEDKATLRRASVLMVTHEQAVKDLLSEAMAEHLTKMCGDCLSPLSDSERALFDQLPEGLQKALLLNHQKDLPSVFREKVESAQKNECDCPICVVIRAIKAEAETPKESNPNLN